MNRLYSLLLAACVIFATAHARQLSPEEALLRVKSDVSTFSPGKRLIAKRVIEHAQPVHTVSDGELACAYIFADNTNSGFMILSADDIAAPVLGYSDSANFDPDNIPPNMAEWLKEYSRQIAFARSSGHSGNAKPDTQAPERAPIAPLCKTLWDQTWPYSIECPTTNAGNAPTGCVATAMAQVMKYHQWPQNGLFDWDNMLDSYPTGGGSTDVQNSAVAHLMVECGESVSMKYGATASGANTSNVATALGINFDYAPTVCCVPGNVFNIRQWEEVIYNQLADFGPVVYSGRPENGTTGHCFVIDGYDRDHYFHVNWGWSGLSNGYYLLTALNPALQGTGGGDSGYTTGHQAILGVQPKGESMKPFHTMWAARYTLQFTKDDSGNPAFVMDNNIVIANYSGVNIEKCYFGVTVENTTTGVLTAFMGEQYMTFPSLRYAYPTGYVINIPANLENGTYLLRPAFRVGEDGPVQLMSTGPNCYMSSMTLEKAGPTDMTLTYHPTLDAALEINDLDVTSRIYPNHCFNLAVNVTNITDSDFSGSLGIAFFPPGESKVTMADIQIWGPFNSFEVPAGETKTVQLQPYCDLTAAPGKYRLGMLDENMQVQGDLIEVEILAAPTSSAKAIRCNNVNINNSNAVNPEAISIEADMKCEKGTFTGQVGFAIYDPLSKALMGSIRTTDDISLSANQNQAIKLSGAIPSLTPGKSYTAIPSCFIGADITSIASDYGERSYTFTVDSRSSIDSVETPDTQIVSVELFDMMGRRLKAEPTSGIYLRRVTFSDGSVTTHKDLK